MYILPNTIFEFLNKKKNFLHLLNAGILRNVFLNSILLIIFLQQNRLQNRNNFYSFYHSRPMCLFCRDGACICRFGQDSALGLWNLLYDSTVCNSPTFLWYCQTILEEMLNSKTIQKKIGEQKKKIYIFFFLLFLDSLWRHQSHWIFFLPQKQSKIFCIYVLNFLHIFSAVLKKKKGLFVNGLKNFFFCF